LLERKPRLVFLGVGGKDSFSREGEVDQRVPPGEGGKNFSGQQNIPANKKEGVSRMGHNSKTEAYTRGKMKGRKSREGGRGVRK